LYFPVEKDDASENGKTSLSVDEISIRFAKLGRFGWYKNRAFNENNLAYC